MHADARRGGGGPQPGRDLVVAEVVEYAQPDGFA